VTDSDKFSISQTVFKGRNIQTFTQYSAEVKMKVLTVLTLFLAALWVRKVKSGGQTVGNQLKIAELANRARELENQIAATDAEVNAATQETLSDANDLLSAIGNEEPWLKTLLEEFIGRASSDNGEGRRKKRQSSYCLELLREQEQLIADIATIQADIAKAQRDINNINANLSRSSGKSYSTKLIATRDKLVRYKQSLERKLALKVQLKDTRDQSINEYGCNENTQEDNNQNNYVPQADTR
jgi:outer membrane murein-binding lipoprotein Lpp